MPEYIMGFWRQVKARCDNPECQRTVDKIYEIRPTSVANLPENLKKLVPVGRYCTICARKMAQAVGQVVKEESEKE